MSSAGELRHVVDQASGLGTVSSRPVEDVGSAGMNLIRAAARVTSCARASRSSKSVRASSRCRSFSRNASRLTVDDRGDHGREAALELAEVRVPDDQPSVTDVHRHFRVAGSGETVMTICSAQCVHLDPVRTPIEHRGNVVERLRDEFPEVNGETGSDDARQRQRYGRGVGCVRHDVLCSAAARPAHIEGSHCGDGGYRAASVRPISGNHQSCVGSRHPGLRRGTLGGDAARARSP